MANSFYDLGYKKILEGGINHTSDTIKIALVTSAYVFSQAHEFYTDLGATVVGTPVTLTGKTITSGILHANNPVFTALTGSAVSQMVIYKDTGAAATSPLIAHYDTSAGLPFTPSGNDLLIALSTAGIY